MKRFILLVVLILFIGGCYDYRELNDMAIVDGILIDYVDDEYKVYLNVIKSSKGKDGNELSNKLLIGSNNIIANAFYEATTMSSNEVYLGHVSLLVLSEELCKKGINEVIDYVLRDVRISNDYSVVVSNDTEIFNKELDNESITDLVNSSLKNNIGNDVMTVDMVGQKLVNDRMDLVLPYLEMEEELVILNKVVHFKDDIFSNIMESKLYNFLMLDTININFNSDNNVINIISKDIKYDVMKDKIVINIDCMGKVMEIESKYNLNNDDNYEKLEKLINKVIYDDVSKFIYEYKDIIGIKDIYYRKYNKVKDIDNIEINVNLSINRNGAIYEVLYD